MVAEFLVLRVKPGFTPRPPFPQILIETLLYIWKTWSSMLRDNSGKQCRQSLTPWGLWLPVEIKHVIIPLQFPLSLYSNVVQLLSHVGLFVTPRTVACKASLSFTISWSLLKLCPLSRWYYLTISSSVAAFCFCLRSFSPSGSFPMS